MQKFKEDCIAEINERRAKIIHQKFIYLIIVTNKIKLNT